MKCNLYVENTIDTWPAENMVRKNCKAQHDVYIFDPDAGTYCCELTPSYCMHPVYGTFMLKQDDAEDPTSVFHDSELLEDLDMRVSDSLRVDCMYIHCSTIKALPHFETKDIPSELPPAFVVIYDEDDVEDIEEFMDGLHGNPVI